MPTLERFIYYRVRPSDDALPRALAMQRDLCARHAGLQARLLRSLDPSTGRETWMESYARVAVAEGVDDATLADIEACAAGALGFAIDGARHVETFEPVAQFGSAGSARLEETGCVS